MVSLEQFRKELHQNPELSGAEYQTQEKIRLELESLYNVQYQKVAKTGIIAWIQGNEEGFHLLFRGDIDALPIEEVHELDYRSVNAGVSHKCGHDGHATSLLGVVRHFSENPPQCGLLYFLFQPAEETGQGAEWVLKDPFFQDLKIDEVYAYHNLPGYALGEVVTVPTRFSAGVVSVALTFKGYNSHAAEPEQGINPAEAISNVLLETRKLEKTDPEKENFTLVTPIYAQWGEKAYGTAAGKGEIHFTLRAWESDRLDNIRQKLLRLAEKEAQKFHLELEDAWFEEFRSTINSKSAVEEIKIAARALNLEHRELERAFRWGEDFGLLTENFSGAMFGLGSGLEQPALHHPAFNYPDELLEVARDIFIQIANQRLNG